MAGEGRLAVEGVLLSPDLLDFAAAGECRGVVGVAFPLVQP